MNTLLWVLVWAGIINTLAIMGCLYFGTLPPPSNLSRFIDAFYTFVLMVWAIVLLVGQK